MFPPTATVSEATRALDWDGEVVGPVSFGGARFWAVVQVKAPEDGRDRSEVRLAGCMVVGSAHADVLREASLLAAYAPRAVLVDQNEDLTALLVDAAILDQGVVVWRPSGVQVLSAAGPRVGCGSVSAREQQLLDDVFAAWQAARVVTVA